MAIDRSSPEFMFGQIMARLTAGDKDMTELKNKIDGLSGTMSTLPCNSHEGRLKTAEKFINDCSEGDKLKVKAGLSLRSGLVLAAFTVVISAIMNLVMRLF